MSKFESMCSEYRENKRLIEELQALNEDLKAGILAIMGDRETVTEGAAKASNKTVTSSRLDSSALKAQAPDIFAQFSKSTTYKRFTVV